MKPLAREEIVKRTEGNRVGAREKTFKSMLVEAGLVVESRTLSRPSSSNRHQGSPALHQEILRMYHQLGGILAEAPYRPGPWDVVLGSVAVELDEEQHFNRYRLATLESSPYRSLDGFPIIAYRDYCRKHETDCVRKAANRGYWSSKSTVKQFGEGSSPGEFADRGSPRWRQRAFYDFLKDLAPDLLGTPVARIAIWDKVLVHGRQMPVWEVLDRRIVDGVHGIVELIEARAGITN